MQGVLAGPVQLHLGLLRECKTDEKGSASIVYSLHAYFISSIHQASVHSDFTRAQSFELHTFIPLSTMSTKTNTSKKRSILVIIQQSSVVSCHHPLGILATLIRCMRKRREGGRIMCMERLYIVSNPEIERI